MESHSRVCPFTALKMSSLNHHLVLIMTMVMNEMVIWTQKVRSGGIQHHLVCFVRYFKGTELDVKDTLDFLFFFFFKASSIVNFDQVSWGVSVESY